MSPTRWGGTAATILRAPNQRLEDKPLHRGPPPFEVRSSKFDVRRSPATVTAAAALCLFLTLLALPPAIRAENAAPPSAEYQLKAVFLFDFAQFVDWPADAFASPTAPLVIGIVGEDPFGSYLDEVVKGEKVGDRPLVVRRYSRDEEDVSACHILFVSHSETAKLPAILQRLRGRPVLTVSDADTFIRAGGLVRFVTENGKIRLRIDLDLVKADRLTISSKVLRFATIVTAEQD